MRHWERYFKLGGEELVKFLQDVLDSLFAMFSTEDGNSTSHSGQVFHVLVSIFSLLEEGKFEHFKPVMDTYIKGHFAAALVYKGLLTSVKHCADFVHTSGNQEALQKCFRSLEYVFKFIIQSRLLFARATDGQYEKKFRDDLNSLFEALNIMLSKNNPSILNIQIAVLHGSSAVFEQLTQVLPTVEATRLAAAMLEALPNVRDLPPQLTQAKLTAIKNLVTSQLFYDDESRNMLLTVCSKHIKMHLAHRDELKLCSEILAEIIRYLFKQRQLQDQGKVNNCIHLDVEILSLNILDHLVHTLNVIMDSHSSILGSLVTCLMGLLQLMDEYHYKRFWEEFVERGTLRNLLLKVFAVFYDLTKKCVFPSDWLIMKMVVNNIILNSLQEFAQPLIFRFLKGQFDISIWSRYFNLAVSYLTQPSLQLERFSQVKREMIMEKYEDMRVLMGFQILSMWSNLRENKIHFIQSMVAPFLEVTLVPEPELRKATLHIFYDMIEVEQSQHGNFKNVENELIDKLDILISQENKGDDEYRQLFHTILLDKVQTEDPQWKESGKAFITSVTRLLERLLDYRSVIHGDENRDKRMHCTVNLLNFYKNEINRKEMYLRYIHRLHDLHLSAENFLEAGFTMKLYADQLTWTQRVLPGDDNYPVEEEWQRKVKLYDQIISYFDRGKAWEKGIPLCKELANLYETKLFDYQKLSSILQTQAKFFDNILTQLRPEPEYFRVGFYGLSFPLFVRNKLFVYRGLEYERIGAFTQRLQTEFPSAQILTKNTPPDDSIVNGDGQFIQISNVKPLSEGNVIFQGIAEVPEKIASYYEINDVKRFQLDRPVHKGPVDKDNEFKSLWIERTILVIAHPLPGILRWFEVTERSVELIPPVQFACETMEAMNRELKQLTAVYNAEPKRNINPFSMRLQGIIDANVMGGIAKYQQAFFSQEFAQNHSEYLPFVSKLKCLLNEQIDLLENALLLHGRLCSSEVQPLHKRLQERFLQLKASFKDFGSRSIINTPLPPVPVDGKKFGQHYDLYSNRYSNSMAAENLYEDGIYSKPAECSGNATPPIPHRKSSSSVGECSIHDRPPKPTHQRSLSKPLSPRTARHVISDDGSTVSLRNSWSEELRNDAEDAPPLPPRGLIPDSKRGPFLHDGQTPTVPPKRPLSQNQKSSSSIFYVDSVETPAEEEPIENHDGGSSSSTEVTMRNDIDKEDLRDSGCFIHDGRPETTSSFNNLSYEDFDLRSRMSVRNNFNIQFNGDGTNASATAEEKQLNTEEGSSPPPVPNPKPNAAVVPPPIPPKSLSLSERRESTENPGTPSASSVQNGGKNENYSVPRLQNQRQ
ncbi:UNVERIFIED_CONTAM: hypothetical protein PYX00_004401 [Menopon gallinae]|uniref:DOCKER domain-containing protein n=1 Tax=Menopon gallinae TaxID=328185 RepID=A0AAW2I5F3_9NEOP